MNHHSTNPHDTTPSSLLRVTAVLVLLAAVSALVVGCATPQVRTETALAGLAADDGEGFIPALFGSPLDPTPTPEPTITPTPEATPGGTALPPPLPAPTTIVSEAPVDFEAARAEAQKKGLDLAFVKIGFHVAATGNANGLGDWERKLNDAGVPIFLKSADAGGPLYEVQQLMKANEAVGRFVPHTLVFRLTDREYELPFYNYDITPEEAAAISWALNRDNFPKQLDKEYVWFETLNEPGRYGDDDNLQIERVARFSLASAKLANSEGYRYVAMSWSPGVPEREDWEHPAMLDFLRYAGENPDTVAVGLHEYSQSGDFLTWAPNPNPPPDGTSTYPYLLGRFQMLFDVCDQYGIPRPTVMFTEWGWAHDSVPEPAEAIADIAWASWMYAAYPQVRGAAIWYLGKGTNHIDDQTQRLIAPLADYSVSHYFNYTPGIGQIDAEIFRPLVPTLLQQMETRQRSMDGQAGPNAPVQP
jgi:hypothetical protein